MTREQLVEDLCCFSQLVLIAQRFRIKPLEEGRLSIQSGEISRRGLRHLHISDTEPVPRLSDFWTQLRRAPIGSGCILELLQAKVGASQVHVNLWVVRVELPRHR